MPFKILMLNFTLLLIKSGDKEVVVALFLVVLNITAFHPPPKKKPTTLSPAETIPFIKELDIDQIFSS